LKKYRTPQGKPFTVANLTTQPGYHAIAAESGEHEPEDGQV